MREMEKERSNLVVGAVLLAAFVLWTAMVQLVDVRPVGQNGTYVGFATFNVWFHNMTGVHMALYTITDWLGLVPMVVCLGFGALGTAQLVRRKGLLQVDADLLLLGVYYIVVILCYLVFEMAPINYRPILIDGMMEASYPSSTTLLVLSVMPTLKLQVDRRAKSSAARGAVAAFVVAFSLLLVVPAFGNGPEDPTTVSLLVLTGVRPWLKATFVTCQRAVTAFRCFENMGFVCEALYPMVTEVVRTLSTKRRHE